MLESLAATLLNRLLGSYVENFDPKQLNVGIWNGDVKLNNLKLRKDCLDSLDLPIDVKFGILDNLVLNVPWSSLKNKPVKIIINDVYLLVVPRNLSNTTDNKERELRLKLQKLAEWELNKYTLDSVNEDSKNETFMQSVITKVIDNLQVVIKNIHIRYEDTSCIYSKFPSSLGITLNEISAVSTDSDWKPSFIEITQTITHKLLTLKSFSLYWNTNSDSFLDETVPQAALIKRFKRYIESADNIQYILCPISGLGRLSINKLGTTENQAHVELDVLFEEFGIELDDIEYADIMYSLSKLQLINHTKKFKLNRPTISVSEDPRKWFKYIGTCVINEIHEKNAVWTWDHIQKRCHQRRKYIEIWIEKLKLPTIEDSLPDKSLETELSELHKELDFDSIVLFRTIAKLDYKKWKASNKDLSPALSQISQEPQKNATWFSSWWNTSKQGKQDELIITEEQKQEFYDVIEFDESEEFNASKQENLANIKIPNHWTTLKITGSLRKGYFAIKKNEQKMKLGEIIFENCQWDFLKRSDSYKTTFKMHEFKIEDGSPNSIYKHIVSPKTSLETKINDELDNIDDIVYVARKEPLFSVVYESNPLDGLSDSKIDLKLLGTTVFYHVHFINEVITFFSPSEEQLDTIGAIISAAEATVEGWSSQTRMGIESLLEEHKTININVDLQTPLIILPINPHSWDTPCAIIDAGHISLVSDIVPKEKIKEIKGMSPDQYEKIDTSDINRLMYDRFSIISQDTQILVGPNVQSTLSNITQKNNQNDFCILNKMKVELTLDISILPKALKLPKFRIFGHLPNLALGFNDYQYKIILDLLEKCFPIFNEPADDYSNVQEPNTNILQDKNEQQKLLTEIVARLNKMSPLEIEQKLLEIHFDIDQAQFSVFQCIHKETMTCKKLIDMVGTTFKFDLARKAKEMNLDMSVHSLNVEDCIENSQDNDLKNLISSYVDGNTGDDLVTFEYKRTQRIVSHEGTLIEVFDQNLNMNLKKLKLVLTPKSLLTLMNYSVLTFTDPNAPELPADVLKHNEGEREDAAQKLSLNFNMAGLDIIFNDSAMKIATLVLSRGQFDVLLLPEKMKLDMKIDGLELTDEINQGADRNSVLRKLISMDNQELFEFSYETFDPTINTNNYDCALKCVVGSAFANFNEDCVKRIFEFLYKFQKMKGYFDRARLAAYNQAPSFDTVNNMKLDVVIKAPILQFPKPKKYGTSSTFDLMTFYLGEIFIANDFEDTSDGGKVNHIRMGVRNGKISSLLNLENGLEQRLSIADEMSLLVNMDYTPFSNETSSKYNISSSLEPMTLCVTELQMKYLYQILYSIQKSLNIEDPSLFDLKMDELGADVTIGETSPAADDGTRILPKEETSTQATLNENIRFNFQAPLISLTLFDNTKDCTDIKRNSITKVNLEGSAISLDMKENGVINGEAHIVAFTVEDTRNVKDNKHSELIPKIQEGNNQFSAVITRKCLERGLLTNIAATINSPRIILAMDHMFAIKKFFDILNISRDSSRMSEDTTKVMEPVIVETRSDDSSNLFQYSMNIVGTAIILLADPSDIDSEAVVFSVGQILIVEQNVVTLSANNIGMFLSKMKSMEESKVRLLDDFSSTVTIDRRDSTIDKLLTNIHVAIEPLIMRISLRDIRLAMVIFNKAVSLLDFENRPIDSKDLSENNENVVTTFSKEFERRLAKYAPSLLSSKSDLSDTKGSEDNIRIQEPDVVLKAETFDADFGGLRMILLGDVHEMPILDMHISPFTAVAKDWSTELDALVTVEPKVNIFNYSRSSWEPLIEPAPISFHLSKGPNQDAGTIFDVIGREITEVTLSSKSISMLSNISASLTKEIRLTPRGSKKPYLLINDTGLDLNVWIKSDDDKERNGLTLLKENCHMPWEFEDWQTIRERLDTDNTKSFLCVAAADMKYESVLTIDATYEGELLHTLKPSVNQVHNRIVSELRCNTENVKVVTFRSTLQLENTTKTPIQVKVKASGQSESIEFTINPTTCGSVPIEYAYNSRIYLKPLGETEFDWSQQAIAWQELLDRPLSFECSSRHELYDKFFIEVNGKYDKREPLAKIYPHMKITISPSIIVENLLPCDINFCIFGRREEMKKFKYLKKSEQISLHDVSLDEFLLFSLEPVLENSAISKPSIVNTPKGTALEPETTLVLNMKNGQRLQLSLKYQSIEGSRAKIIKIFSPYVIINHTDKDLYVESSRSNIAVSKIVQATEKRYTLPFMFSFDKDNQNNNRARFKFKDSDWSIPVSFDGLGQSFDVTLNEMNRALEYNLGVNISEGEGKYVLSRIINVTPRYIVKNELEFPIELCEIGSANVTKVETMTSIPLYKMRTVLNKQLMIRKTVSGGEWSTSFSMKDVGLSYVKLLTEEGLHMLLKVEIILEDATLFIVIKDGKNSWPYSIRNFSDTEFIFYQRDINILDDYYEADQYDEQNEVEYKPLYYRVPPRSVMPYAWDYPTAKQKKLIITSGSRKREIQLAEIGNLKPMRIPARMANEETVIVDLNVIADGPTQALVITNYNSKLSLYKLRARSGPTSSRMGSNISLSSSGEVFEARDEDKDVFTKIVVSFKGIGISLIDANLKELAYTTFRGVEFRYNNSSLYQTFSWKIKWLQIDNQLFGATYNNVLYPTAIPKTSQEIENHPVLSGSVSKVKDDSYGVPYFKHATLLVQEFSLQLDEDFVYSLIDFLKFPGAPWHDVDSNNNIILKETVGLPEVKEVNFSNDFYFEMFHIQPTLLHLSFVRTERLNSANNGPDLDKVEEIENTTASTSTFLLHVLTMTVGNVNDAPIKLNSLFLDNVRVPLTVLFNSIKTHYSQQFFYQIHMILGSADFLGNPVGLFNTISSGVWDLFYEPYQGYIMNDRPQEMGIHIAKGGLSFVKKTVFGVSDSMAKLTGAVAKGLSVTQDSKFQESRRLQQRINKNSTNIFQSSAESFASTIGSGISGLAVDPYRGVQREGAAGFFKGLGTGLIGLPTKTAIGILDLTSNLSQGVKNTTTALDMLAANRVRIPRYIDPFDQVVKCYNLRQSQGQYWLKSANGGLYLTDRYLSHVVLPGKELVVVVSMERIAEIRIATQQVMWGTAYSAIQGITLERGGIRIKLKSQSEYFIPISDPQERKSVYKSIAIAVTEYNKYCEAVL
ncbi:hypothetical protein KAFR_0L00240 [Kazachstania africana CBS 2517]|uniref:Vacuolar protein sorting-associated protein n=1 Tax=Kazachstania africana (strain ATCC 22294 / BCRC 22015 / CBS 2517 / CECT 1963 / NBRC 1671 / NRRL Y-8276) TaxID=1071382 RepID=H2B1Y1_KAZAF|nr:hypothetical protein KAFR_0L00240 [Kazachstania africana CBS 2517]CCF60631.1 hypothetical protein KAFR_0L00240 [Kazachstania africana CBS 2517]